MTEENTMSTAATSCAAVPNAPFLTDMSTALPTRQSRTTEALLSLMNLYEQGEGVQEAEESETELMVLLCGMVGVDTSLLAGE